ncbi:MAG: hypothetical protein QM621_09000 [Aeromicrobium sp.]|uniref:hypothetical protein n=1 Tax=Aeromicrobium sp. TaxID=1871063 RepID=UPI0039E6F2CD
MSTAQAAETRTCPSWCSLPPGHHDDGVTACCTPSVGEAGIWATWDDGPAADGEAWMVSFDLWVVTGRDGAELANELRAWADDLTALAEVVDGIEPDRDRS